MLVDFQVAEAETGGLPEEILVKVHGGEKTPVFRGELSRIP